MSSSIVIERRFCGPAASGNGGFTCGRLAAFIPGSAEVTLRSPPPLETSLQVVLEPSGVVELRDGDTLIAQARPARVEVEVPAPVTLEMARTASTRFIGFAHHPYPMCFVCGTGRPAQDGLGLHAGAVEGRAVAATVWTPAAEFGRPDGQVEPHFVWCALDCPSWFGHASFIETVPRILLGRLAVDIERLPRVGEDYVVLGWSIGAEGRRIVCGAALHDGSGRFLARAVATWIALRQ
jgi:hypothetical protein